jgi:hypothetical protein
MSYTRLGAEGCRRQRSEVHPTTSRAHLQNDLLSQNTKGWNEQHLPRRVSSKQKERARCEMYAVAWEANSRYAGEAVNGMEEKTMFRD